MSDIPERLRKIPVITDSTFKPPPYYDEIFKNKDTREHFNQLQGNYRHFINRLITTGKFDQAVAEAKLSKSLLTDLDAKAYDNQSFKTELKRQGCDKAKIVEKLLACLDGKVVKVDKKGNHKEYQDSRTSLAAIDKLLQLYRGDYDPKGGQEDEDVTELFKELEKG